MIYYLQNNVGSRPQLWKVEDGLVWGLRPLKKAEPYSMSPEQHIWDVIPGGVESDFVKTSLHPGQFFPRMARPSDFGNIFSCPVREEDVAYISESLNQFTYLMQNLYEICRVVRPDVENLSVYGHEIRNLLILCCTEVESHWKGILRNNGCNNVRLTTKDYVKLLTPLKLNEYKIQFSRFKWLGDYSPFSNWDAANPTNSIEWYDAYNGVKHDREKEFYRAKLRYIFESISACIILLYAQFGEKAFGREMGTLDGYIISKNIFFSSLPVWNIEEYYLEPEFKEANLYLPMKYIF